MPAVDLCLVPLFLLPPENTTGVVVAFVVQSPSAVRRSVGSMARQVPSTLVRTGETWMRVVSVWPGSAQVVVVAVRAVTISTRLPELLARARASVSVRGWGFAPPLFAAEPPESLSGRSTQAVPAARISANSPASRRV